MQRVKKEALLFFSLILLSSLSAKEFSVKITSPHQNQQFDVCSDITLVAEATVDEGEVTEVMFTYNTYSIKTVRGEPFEYTWEGVPAGIYELRARARDNDRNIVYSEPVQIFVGDYEDGNLILNSQFECGTIEPWKFVEESGGEGSIEIVSDSEISVDSSAAMIKINNVGSVYWSIQLEQKYPLKQDHYYEISFSAAAPQTKQISLELQSRTTWEVYWTQNISISQPGVYGPYEYECPVDDDNTYFQFLVAYDTTSLYLDDIYVFDTDWTDVKSREPVAVKNFELFQNFPNPFNPGTTIKYSLKNPETVRLVIYNLRGELVTVLVDEAKAAGIHTVDWSGRNDLGRLVNSGLYIYKLTAGREAVSRKLLLVK
ncbi:carbohydrate binding domain-containing protein [candidate division KSB1 bacterium]|nr:carbohydrate binding domain-containing protein [candidate division KSB1 bacterium]